MSYGVQKNFADTAIETERDWILLFYVSVDDISVTYVTTHRCAVQLKKVDLTLGSKMCPSKH